MQNLKGNKLKMRKLNFDYLLDWRFLFEDGFRLFVVVVQTTTFVERWAAFDINGDEFVFLFALCIWAAFNFYTINLMMK